MAQEDLSHYSLPVDSQPSSVQRQWALATTAIFSDTNGEGTHDLRVPGHIALRDLGPWGIVDRPTLLDQLDWLRQKGYRADFAERIAKLEILSPREREQVVNGIGDDYTRYAGTWRSVAGSRSLKGLDYVLYISLCRWGRSAGYMDDAEAWRLIMPAARLLQSTFPSWQALGRNYLLGRNYWDASGRHGVRGASLEWSYMNLLESADSLWRTLPWNSDLGKGAPKRAAESVDTSAYLRLFPHPRGLNCFSLTLFQQTGTSGLTEALSTMSGCPVRLWRNCQIGGNTELEGDCFRPQRDMHATQIRVEYPLNP